MNKSPMPFPRYQEIVDDYPAFCRALARPLPVTLWGNPDRITPADLSGLLTTAGMTPAPIPWYPGGFRLPAEERAGKRWEFFSGLYQIQEEAALLPVTLLAPQPGELILDMCAAPGNKTAQIAFAMKNRGTVIANDLNRKRLPALRQTCERLGLRNVSVVNHNAGNIPSHAGRFDRVLVDAPCSCEGTTRKNPGQAPASEIHFSVKQCGAQAALLRKAIQLCRPGGLIVYSTCTYAPEENEAVVNDVLTGYGDEYVELMAPDVPAGLTISHGITEWDNQSYHRHMHRCLRLWPHQNDTGGFFVAVLRKKQEVASKSAVEFEETLCDLPEAPEPPLKSALERFGISASEIDGMRTITGRGEQLFLVADDHRVPAYFARRDTGLRCLRIDSEVPKPTHPGALFLGQCATRNIVQLNEDRLLSFMGREAFDLEESELIECDGNGFVMVKHGPFACGLAILCTAEDGHHYLVSNYPRRWAARLFS